MGDNEPFYFGSDNDVNVYWNGTYLHLAGINAELSISFATATETKIYGGVTDGDHLVLYANTVNATPWLSADGGSGFIMCLPNTGVFQIWDVATPIWRIYNDGTDTLCESLKNGIDFFIKTTGTGLVKFGTSANTGDVVCNGYVTILDNAGNPCKLMRCA